VLDVENRDELLKPGMTAQVRLVVGNRDNVLRIPTAALRFRLSDEEQEKELKKRKAADAGKQADKAVPPPADDDDLSFRSKDETARQYKIYKLDAKNQAVPVDIKIGLSNFRFTEVVGGDLKKGDRVVTRALSGEGKAE
jgi:HlyD family secretion protein